MNAQTGLFKVTDGIYQLRGFDIANMTLIEGKSGWIVVDPLTSKESASVALAFARKQLGDKSVTAIVFTHSHGDHFGGALGLVSAKHAAQSKLPIVAPEGFVEEATSENILVGTGMARRSTYQFGRDLECSPKGNVDTGLGKTVVYGAVGILQPTVLITKPSQELVLDGVRFVFHNVPGAEAPAELTFNITDRKAYGGAENLAQTMHNLLPVRGAKVRDALRWAGYMQQALDELGNARIREFITQHRDVYKYTHDQTVRLLNAGYTPREIAEPVQLPPSLSSYLGTRGYYGDLRHNVKAVYQLYLGAYDGNPANLNPYPPQESAKRYLELIGGADKAVAAAQTAFDKGDCRWAAELRNSPPKKGLSRALVIDMLAQTPTERFLEAMAAGLNGPDAAGKDFKINLVFTDIKKSYVLWIENAVLHHKTAAPASDANATLSLTKDIFIKMMAGTAGAKDTLLSDDLKVTGGRIDLVRFFGLIDKATGTFAIVTK